MAIIGCYLGYALAHYADFYPLRHVLLLGRVSSGEGGRLILDGDRKVLEEEFPALARGILLHLPEEETERRVARPSLRRACRRSGEEWYEDAEGLTFAMDLTPLLFEPHASIVRYVASYIERFAAEVGTRLTRLGAE